MNEKLTFSLDDNNILWSGADGLAPQKGSESLPYTVSEYEDLVESGEWNGGIENNPDAQCIGVILLGYHDEVSDLHAVLVEGLDADDNLRCYDPQNPQNKTVFNRENLSNLFYLQDR